MLYSYIFLQNASVHRDQTIVYCVSELSQYYYVVNKCIFALKDIENLGHD